MTDRLYTANGRIAWYPGDGSERCLVCGTRDRTRSVYVGQAGITTDEGYPERFPVCSEMHGFDWMRRLWMRAIQDANEFALQRRDYLSEMRRPPLPDLDDPRPT